jgi:signal transduction histidine kinase
VLASLVAALALAAAGWLWRLRARAQRDLTAMQAQKAALDRSFAAVEAERDAARAETVAAGGARGAAEMERDGLAALLAAAPFPAWRRGADLAIHWGNAAYLRAVGTLGGEIQSALLPEQGRALAAGAREAEADATELRHFVVDGQRRALEVVERPDGAGFAHDVTDREEARAELRRYVDASSEVLNNLNTAIVIFGPNKRATFFNHAYARLWRFDEDWLASGPLHGEVIEQMREHRLLPEQADYPAFKAAVHRLYTDLLETSEELMHRPDGRVLRQLVSPHPLGGLLVVYEDVTDRLALERSYNTLIAVQQETLANLYEGVAVFGADGRLKLSNPAYARIWRFDPALLEGEPHVSELVDAARPLFSAESDWRKLSSHLVAQVTERRARNGRMERPDGGVIDFAAVPLPDGATLFTYIDVTDSANVERALRDRNEALETADRLKTEFLANVSYELRSPLNVIIGFAEILGNEYFGDLNARQKEYASGMLESSHHLLALINDILDLSSFEAGQLELELEPFDLHPALEGTLALGRERARKQRLSLQLECASDLGGIVADERRIKQALFNLLSNAIKFTPPGGRVSLGAERRGDEIAIWVADTGIGIDAEERTIVFEKFQRGRRAKSRKGAGLGLSLVKSIVELHGGRVELESQIGVGTRITCLLPVAPTASAALAAGDAA